MGEERTGEERDQTYPSLFRSMIPGKRECTYVDVQMKRRITRRRDWKLKIAVWGAC